MIIPKKKWRYAYKEGLVRVLVIYKDARWRDNDDGYWTAEGWKEITNEFNKKFPGAYATLTEIMKQTRSLKTTYELIEKLIKRSDMLWDPINGCVSAPDHVWDDLIEEDPRVRKVRDEIYPYYVLLVSVFEEASLPKPPAKWPFAYEEGLVRVLVSYKDARWRDHDDGYWNAEGWIEVTNEFNKKFPNAHVTATEVKRQTRELKTTYQSINEIRKRIDEIWEAELCWTVASNYLWEEIIQADPGVTLAKDQFFPFYHLLVSLFEASLPKPPAKRCVEIINVMEELTPAKRKRSEGDEFSISRCVEIINGMEELTEDEVLVGCDVFHDASDRESFISLSPSLRIPWIRRKIARLT